MKMKRSHSSNEFNAAPTGRVPANSCTVEELAGASLSEGPVVTGWTTPVSASPD